MTRNTFLLISVLALGGAVACSEAKADVEKVPVGTDVQLTSKDGGVVQGKLTEKDATNVKVLTGKSEKTTKTVARENIADVRVVDASKPVELPAIAKFREYTVPAGTTLKLTIESAVSSETAKVEDTVEAKLADAVSVDGAEVLPAGAAVRGNVSAVEDAGKIKGRSSLGLMFSSITAWGERHQISARWAAEAASTKKDDAKKIGIGAGAGAIIGGIIGGKKGAATGAAVGGGAGTAMVLTSEGKPVALANGSEISVKLANPLDVKVPIK
ncbi:MAG TPA: hypothetical protein VN700_11450 [Vicinamibacterales bacterium]|nr:hypothetical protein [Vicinamibacterales bacterium]